MSLCKCLFFYQMKMQNTRAEHKQLQQMLFGFLIVCLPSVLGWSDWFQSLQQSNSVMLEQCSKRGGRKKAAATRYRKLLFWHRKNVSHAWLWWSFVAADAFVITVITSSGAAENRRRCSTFCPASDESNDLFGTRVPSFFFHNCISSHRFSSIYI